MIKLFKASLFHVPTIAVGVLSPALASVQLCQLIYIFGAKIHVDALHVPFYAVRVSRFRDDADLLGVREREENLLNCALVLSRYLSHRRL